MTDKIFNISGSMDRFCGMIFDHSGFWLKMGELESGFLRDEIDAVRIEKPVYVCGLARSGSTILLEILSKYQGVVTHCYKDFPPVFTPYWWNRFLKWGGVKKDTAQERAHRDRIYVTPDSPEAVEEAVWMAFFRHIHDIDACNVLDADTSNHSFETFYSDHIRKLLIVRQGCRYLAKANYNITRMEYILKIFPDAGFVIPVRDPVSHIKSLIKQHRLFIKGQKEDGRAVSYLKRIGHFEFGQDFRPVNTGNTEQNLEIKTLVDEGKYIIGWTRYWNQIYGYISGRLVEREALRKASIVVVYDDLCTDTAGILERIQQHCGLPENPDIILEYEEKITPPDYYKMEFTREEEGFIKNETRDVFAAMKRLGAGHI